MAASNTAPRSPKPPEGTPRGNEPGRVIQFPGTQTPLQVQERQYLDSLERANAQEPIKRARNAVEVFEQLHEAARNSVRRLLEQPQIITRAAPMPAAGSALEDAIRTAERAILSLEDDWDEAG